MISRYQRSELKNLWSDEQKFNAFLDVELASSYAWMKQGLFDKKVFDALKHATFVLDDIYALEEETKHDVIAFTRAVSKSLGDEKKWFHYGLTSTDIVDTAQSLILKKVNEIILDDLDQLMDVLKLHAFSHKMTPAMGRTHGIHAEITSFGLKFALWYEDFKRLKQHFFEAASQISMVKMSGAVGNYSASNPLFQTDVAKKLGLPEVHIATQTLQRDRHAFYMSILALIASQLEKMAVEIRHLSRTEVGEVSEYFSIHQKGSSAMPHKRNPISSENISGLSRVVRGYMMSSYENIALWHERDISHSSVERIILQDATSLVDYMLHRFTKTLASLVIKPEKMLKNIQLTHGVIFAQSILNHLIHKGMNREEAYDMIQALSLKALDLETSLKVLINDEVTLKPYITDEDMTSLFSIEKHLKYVDDIYKKVFGFHNLS